MLRWSDRRHDNLRRRGIVARTVTAITIVIGTTGAVAMPVAQFRRLSYAFRVWRRACRRVLMAFEGRELHVHHAAWRRHCQHGESHPRLNFVRLRSKAEGFLKQMSAMESPPWKVKAATGLDKETELLQLRVMRSLHNDEHKRVDIVSTFLGAHAVPPEYGGRCDRYVDYLIRGSTLRSSNDLAGF